MTMKSMRTDDTRFRDLPGYSFKPHYLEGLPGFEGLRLHYVDEGPRDAAVTFLCLHGEPTWAYLYRKMIPVFTAAGHRVIAPDWFGFGRSDKPVEDGVYSVDFHRRTMLAFLRDVRPSNLCLVCQDWGGILGLSLPMELPGLVTRLLVMNTAMPIGASPSTGFLAWKAFAKANPDLDVAALMKRSTQRLTDAEAAAYAAPFPDIAYKAGVRRFPELVMVEPGMEGVDVMIRARKFWREDWQGESFMAIGAADPVLGPDVMSELRAAIRGCPEPMIIAEAGHFVQEWGAEVAAAALRHFRLG